MLTKKKTIFFIVLPLGLLLLALAFYIFSQKMSGSENLTMFMPRHTELYVEYNLKDKKLIEFGQTNFRGQTRWELLLKQAGFFGDLSPYLLREIDQLALLVVNTTPDAPTGVYEKVWLIKADNIHRLSALLPAEYYYSNLNSKTIVITRSHALLKKVKPMDPLTEYSVDQRRALSKFDQQNFFKVYLSGTYAKFLANRNDALYFFLLNNLNLDYDQPVAYGLTAVGNKISFNFWAASVASQKNKDFKATASSLLKFVNFKDKQAPWLTLAAADLKAILNQLKTNLLSADQLTAWQTKYGFSWSELEEILDTAGVLVVENQHAQLANEAVLNTAQNNYVMVVATNFAAPRLKQTQDKIQQVIKNILAFKYPTSHKVRLPDGTSITEEVADPAVFKFETQAGVDFIQVKNFRWVMATQDNYLLLGNSKELLENILNNPTPADNLNCPLLTAQETLWLNSQRLSTGLLSFIDQLIINLKQDKKDLELTGCLLW